MRQSKLSFAGQIRSEPQELCVHRDKASNQLNTRTKSFAELATKANTPQLKELIDLMDQLRTTRQLFTRPAGIFSVRSVTVGSPDSASSRASITAFAKVPRQQTQVEHDETADFASMPKGEFH
ncbi:hypothetical protein FNAPI_10737 [Fusarium napiforme]|uniref:Uncharacterized protein n=1 Tax=Fusarium napiforme TaxID=42672 RepID=A0A8H5IM16_9HYPO|nr:hypothetical protein FNAPI_10737 [Fusarium napiforme]